MGCVGEGQACRRLPFFFWLAIPLGQMAPSYAFPKTTVGVSEMWLARKYRVRSREIACDSWVRSEFDYDKAKKLTKQAVAEGKAKGEFGSVLVAVMVTYYVVLLAQMAFKFWKSKQIKHPPEKSIVGEPFGLCGDEA